MRQRLFLPATPCRPERLRFWASMTPSDPQARCELVVALELPRERAGWRADR